MEEQKQRLMSQVPKTAAGFSRDFKALKKDTSAQLAYLKRIPLPTLKSYFNKTEIESATINEILRTLAKEIASQEDTNWAHDFLVALSKSFKFDTTVMFFDDEENESVDQIVKKIAAVDSAKADEIKAAYTD